MLIAQVTDPEETWQAVFKSMGVDIQDDERAELEYRKAFYKYKSDREWLNEILKIELEHYTILGAIIEFTHPKTEGSFKVNPLELPNN